MPKVIPSTRSLISEPFGPYPEHQILNDRLGRKGCLELRSVSMECAGLPIGLDDTEFIISAREGSKFPTNHVQFYGKLKIQSLDWLSEQGRRWLELDLRERDREIHREHALNGLTLARLYGDMKNSGMRMTVWIQCEKNMQASFLVDGHENSLIFYTKASRETLQIDNDNSTGRDNGGKQYHTNRMYDIKSLDVGTFQSSQKFLTRYRLWALIDDVIAKDRHNTPLENRTIDWLVDNYFSHFRKRDLYQRLIFDPSRDDDVDKDGTTTKQRYLRHVPRAEIFGIFAAHAEWILAQHLATTSNAVRKLDIPSWILFCQQVKRARKAAALEKVQWGVSHGVKNITKSHGNDLDLAQFGQTPEFWARRIKTVTKKTTQKPIEEPTRYSPEIPAIRPKTPNFGYDSDFSVLSTSSDSDTDSDIPYSPGLASKVPPFCMVTPELPAGRFKWECPGCAYTIDLLNLTEANTKGLSDDLGNYLRQKSWKYLNEDRVKRAIQKMISTHYNDHLRRNGVQVKWDWPGKCYIARRP